MRGFFFGFVLVVALVFTILSIRPGGIRRQLRMAGRRFRIFLWLGGIYFAGSIFIRLAFPEGVVSDYGPPALALVLAGVFAFIGQDPSPSRPGT